MGEGSAPGKSIRGTREWAVAEVNCCIGCRYGCRYCYARHDAVSRKMLVKASQWNSCQVIDTEVERTHPLYSGQVMFPTAHDIVAENLDTCLRVLTNLLDAGNRVLVVTKPNFASIKRICRELQHCRRQLLLRFTITARDRKVLDFWEPGAPEYGERKDCLEFAYDSGFATSVSVEPMLDTSDVVAMVHELLPFVSHSIWLGKMNKIETRVRVDSPRTRLEVERIRLGQRDEQLRQLYRQLTALDKVRWKESIKTVVGIDLAKEPGLDI